MSTYKIATVFTFTFFNIANYLLLNSVSKKKTALLVSFFTLFNPFLIFFSSQYTKNLLGVSIVLLALYLLIRKRFLFSIVLLIVSFYTHKLAFVIGLGVMLIYFLKKQLDKVPTLVICFLIMVFFSFIFLFAYEHEADVKLQFAPLSFFGSHKQVMTNYWIFYLGLIVLVFLGALFIKRQNILSFILLPILTFLIIPVLKWNQLGIALRMFLIFSILTPILLVCFSKYLKPWMLSLFLMSSFFSVKVYNPRKLDPPYKLYDFMSKKLIKNVNYQNSSLVIAHKSLAEFLSFESNKDVLPWAIKPNEINDNVLRIVYVPYSLKLKFKRLLTNKIVLPLTSEYFLIQEKHWRNSLLNNLNEEEKVLLSSWKNPIETRVNYFPKQYEKAY